MLNYIHVLPIFFFSGGGISWELGQSFAGHEGAKPKAKGRIGWPLLFSEKSIILQSDPG